MAEMSAGAPLGASYTLVEQVGKGASGQVWRLDHAKKSEPLAAKILHHHLTADTSVVERFVRERSVLLSLKNKNIVAVHDLVVEGETLALVMDYCAGGSLRDVIQKSGTLAPAQALKLTATVLETLAFAHGKNVIHRDIKPDNILFAVEETSPHSENLRITDFGIASLVQEGKSHTTTLAGTPHYLPPELIQNGVTGPAGDVYSTGIMLYELLAGRTPFAGEGTDFTVAYRHVSATVPPLDLPEPIMQELMSLLSKNPDRRPHALDSAGRLRALADRFADLPPLTLSPEPNQFSEVERPKTVIRGLAHDTAPALNTGADETDAPNLGEAPLPTVIRPEALKPTQPAYQSTPDETEDTDEQKKAKSKMLWLSVIGVVLLIATGWGIYWAVSSSSQNKEPFSALGKQESPLPSGLSVRREATYTPSTSTINLKVVYSAQKAPLSGEILEVLPPTTEDATCPNATWDRIDGQRNQPTITDMTVKCGWTLKGIDIKPNQEYEVQATVHAQVADQKALESWLDAVSTQTEEAITSADYQSTSYVAQRLQNIEVKVPARTVSQTVIPVKLIPVWPSGEDLLNPIYSSETAGKPTGMLQAIAGDDNPIRFSDGCSGHIAVDESGLKVTALSVAERCTVLARVGNFTDLQSDNFTITTRD